MGESGRLLDNFSIFARCLGGAFKESPIVLSCERGRLTFANFSLHVLPVNEDGAAHIVAEARTLLSEHETDLDSQELWTRLSSSSDIGDADMLIFSKDRSVMPLRGLPPFLLRCPEIVPLGCELVDAASDERYLRRAIEMFATTIQRNGK